MTNYLALIRKADFTDLFKYGKLHINNDMKTDFSCPVEELPSHPEIFFNLTYFANSFDSAFAYLIIHYVKASSEGLANDVNIEEVQNVYPLDFESKEAFAMSFDERIRIEDPIWPESVWNLQKQQQFNDCQKGAANLRKILGFTSSDQECKKIISDDIVREVVNELYDEKRPSGELSIWVYLLRYERHSYYPQTTLGYFMDMVNVVCNRMGMREVWEDDIKNTQIFMLLDSLRNKYKAQYEQIYQFLIDNPATQGFYKKIDEFESRVEFSKVATLFLILRNRYKEDFVYEEDFIKYSKKFGFEFELAVYLLGIVKGHEHTYDCMYDMLPLPIFKKTAKTHITNESGWKPFIDNIQSQDEFQNKNPETPISESPHESNLIPSKLGADGGDNILDSSVQQEVPVQEPTESVESSVQEASVQQEAPVQEPAEAVESSVQEASVQQEAPVQEPAEVVESSVQEASVQQEAPVQEPAEVVESSVQEASVQQETPVQEPAEVVESSVQEASVQQEAPVQEPDSLSQSSDVKDLFGEDTIKYPIYMRKPTGGRPRIIKNEKDYAKKHYKNLLDGYTIESNE